MTKLPDAVKAMVTDEPLVEDVVLDILREKIPQIFWADETEQSVPPPFGIVRRDTYIGTSEKDHRFISRAYCAIHTFTEGVDADIDNSRLQEAVKLTLLGAGYRQPKVRDWGYVSSVRLVEPYVKRSDWQNSEGPVQYADLPNDYTRFESVWEVKIRRAQLGPHFSTQ